MQHPQLPSLLADLRRGLADLYGPRLAQVILYGSQARGDAELYSDVDVLVVLWGPVDDYTESGRTSELVAALSLKYTTVISRFFVSWEEFQAQASAFLQNVHHEGRVIS